MTAQGNKGSTDAPAGGPKPADPAAPFEGLDPAVIAGKVFTEAAVRVSSVVKPAAAAAVATTFSFPLVLMIGGPVLPARAAAARRPRSQVADRTAVGRRRDAGIPGRGSTVNASGRAASTDRVEYTALSDRMGHLLVLRVAMGLIVVAWAALRPEAVGIDFAALLIGTVAYLVDLGRARVHASADGPVRLRRADQPPAA